MMFSSCQSSATFPSRMRAKNISFQAASRPVGGFPCNQPSWVPLKMKRAATRSPAAINSWTVTRLLGQPTAIQRIIS